MKKITLLAVMIITLGALTAQTTNKPIVKKSVFFGKSKAIRDVTIVLPGTEKETRTVKMK